MSGERQYLDRAIGRYPAAVADTARAALEKLRARFPGARRVVYERRGSLPIGLAPDERGSAVFSLVLYPRWVRFFFLEGVALSDPEGRLEGDGKQVRSIVVDDRAAVLDDPYIRMLMTQAVKIAGADLRTGSGRVVLRSTLGSPRRSADESARERRTSSPEAGQNRAPRASSRPGRV